MQSTIQENIQSKRFWEELNPGLKISDFPFKNTQPISVSEAVIDKSIDQLKNENYFHTLPIIPEVTSKHLAEAIQKVVSACFPAVYAFDYDDFWELAKKIKTQTDLHLVTTTY
ncbi:MAG: hypothetical protein QM500_02250 [Methylococcales bacterium]